MRTIWHFEKGTPFEKFRLSFVVNLPDLRPPASFVHAPTWLRLIEEQVTFVSADRVLGDIVDVQSISFELKGCISLI